MRLLCLITITQRNESNMMSRDESRRVSLEHLNAHTGLPPELVPALLAVEVECRVRHSHFFSYVGVFKNKRWFMCESGLVPFGYVLGCMTDNHADCAYSAWIDRHFNLAVAYVSKKNAWTAVCPREHHPNGFVLGDWTVEQKRVNRDRAGFPARPLEHCPCWCGSGKSYRTCCGKLTIFLLGGVGLE